MPGRAGNIVLIGFMGAGKTEVGRKLAARTGREFVDTDEVVIAGGGSIDAIFASEGEAGFRRRERRAIAEVAKSTGAVIATGGGSVIDPRNVRALKRNGVFVYLEVGGDELTRRLAKTAKDRVRPLLDAEPSSDGLRGRVRSLLAARRSSYESAADVVVACDGLGTAQTLSAVEREISKRRAPSVTTVRVALTPPYTVRIGRGLLGSVPRLVPIPKGAENACIVSHPRIRNAWGASLERGLSDAGLRVVWSTFPEGEDHKSIATAVGIASTLAKKGFHRTDVLVALGGGVVGDVCGYVASTYGRGMAYAQVPTTLLAMVDASIGGKTAVNLPEGKNLFGSFHQPIGVVSDMDVLSTLSDRELRGGLAEAVKTGLIGDPPLVSFIERNRDEILQRGDRLQQVVVRCARAKAAVVAADPLDRGVRMTLNYGHTLGHALEAATLASYVRSGSHRLHHGEAVAIGMVFAAEVAAALGRLPARAVEDHCRVLEAIGLPTRRPAVTWGSVSSYMSVDKKYAGGVRMVLLDAPGRPELRRVPADVLRAAYERLS